MTRISTAPGHVRRLPSAVSDAGRIATAMGHTIRAFFVATVAVGAPAQAFVAAQIDSYCGSIAPDVFGDGVAPGPK